jgi:hypothetical protein
MPRARPPAREAVARRQARGARAARSAGSALPPAHPHNAGEGRHHDGRVHVEARPVDGGAQARGGARAGGPGREDGLEGAAVLDVACAAPRGAALRAGRGDGSACAPRPRGRGAGRGRRGAAHQARSSSWCASPPLAGCTACPAAAAGGAGAARARCVPVSTLGQPLCPRWLQAPPRAPSRAAPIVRSCRLNALALGLPKTCTPPPRLPPRTRTTTTTSASASLRRPFWSAQCAIGLLRSSGCASVMGYLPRPSHAHSETQNLTPGRTPRGPQRCGPALEPRPHARPLRRPWPLVLQHTVTDWRRAACHART